MCVRACMSACVTVCVCMLTSLIYCVMLICSINVMISFLGRNGARNMYDMHGNIVCSLHRYLLFKGKQNITFSILDGGVVVWVSVMDVYDPKLFLMRVSNFQKKMLCNT